MISGEKQGSSTESKGLPGKNGDVQVPELTMQEKTFSDIASHKNQSAIEALAARGIISGKTEGQFMPDATMTRAEFAAIVVKALGLEPKANGEFLDIPSGAWYAPYVGTAFSYGIINGTSDGTFNPGGTITKQEAAVMIARAGKLCGMEVETDTASIRDTLSQFTDYITVDEWARPAMAFCYQENLLAGEDLEILPKIAVKRCEIAEMLCQMLKAAELI